MRRFYSQFANLFFSVIVLKTRYGFFVKMFTGNTGGDDEVNVTIESLIAAMADGGRRHGRTVAEAAVDPRVKGEEATPGKDCRACTDFKSWAKMQRGAFRGRNSDAEANEEVRCLNQLLILTVCY